MNTTVMQATDRARAPVWLRDGAGPLQAAHRRDDHDHRARRPGRHAAGRRLSLAQVLVLALSVLVASASAGAFNQYVEADSDRLMARTRRRAFASGALRALRRRGWC